MKILVYILKLIHKILFTQEIWVFGSFNKTNFFHNSKALFLYTNQQYKHKITPVWITANKILMNEIRENDMKCYDVKSFYGMLYCLLAKYHIVDWGIDNINAKYCKYSKQVNLWHGIPLKRLERDIQIEPLYSHIRTKECIKAFYSRNFGRPSFMFACSEYDKEKLSSAFDVPLQNIYITGMARNDWLFDKIQPTKKDIINIKNTSQILTNYKKTILYLPTFRDGKNEDIFSWISDDFVQFLENYNIVIFCKMHIADSCKDKRVSHSNVQWLEQDVDLYPLLHLFDCLVTDYSSIYFDFALTGKQIVHFCPDIDEYKKYTRGLYIELSQNLGGSFCTDIATLKKAIMNGENYSLDVVKKFHYHRNGNYCENIINILQNDKI